ncbi:MAG: family 20 glycosylhydrolase [Parabacteroides sp.]|nr:family 20 glycosylhydrolase [Parabacteroides sp.]
MLIPKRVGKVLGGTLLVGSVLFTSCNQTVETQILLIPEPFEMTQSDGMFKVSQAMLVGAGSASNKVNFRVDPNATDIPDEGYQLEIDEAGVRLTAKTETGLFYGKQTLLQLLTPNGLPYVKINDQPRFPYRGLHLDVSRHFFDKEEVKKLMNVMSYYKLNTLHLHLTDAGGWRLQIDKYPKLTQEGAFRTQSDWREWWDNGKDRQYLKEGTEGAYGGYYTKDDIRDMLAYAAEKHITIIPEIEFPAHSDEVFVAYPELCCAGKSHTSGDFCIGNPKTFEFMENVLTEVIELFPSEYIHIGGDEAGKNTWKTCPKCQALMKKEKLANVDELQSYMIRKAEEFLNSKGRRLIGWDEILEGGLAPEATVMSWRGEAAGFKSARMGHDVIMTPGSYMYFDFYQADPRYQPVAIGGYTPIRKVYNYNPIPQDSLTAEEAKHFLGVQANTWTEYIPTPEHLEYMMFPRALAVAEIGWTPQEKRDWQDFKPRVNAHIPVLQQMGLNPFPLSNELEFDMVVDTIQKEIRVTMDAEKYPAEIHYTTDGSTPTASSPIYQEPIVVKDSAKIVAGIFVNGQLQDRVSEQRVDYHKGIGKSIRFNSRLYPGYMAGGINAIINGYRGGLTYLDQRWQGYTDNLDCVIDLGEVMDLHQVSSKWMQLTGPGVYQPEKVEVLTSEDGKNFTSQGVIPTTIPQDKSDLTFQEYTFQGNWKARYVQFKAQNPKGFIFVDEIVIW